MLLLVAFFTLFERKVIGSVQKRLGPVYTGFFGLFQPISDAIKLILKEVILPKVSDYNFFILSPISIFFLSIFKFLLSDTYIYLFLCLFMSLSFFDQTYWYFLNDTLKLYFPLCT